MSPGLRWLVLGLLGVFGSSGCSDSQVPAPDEPPSPPERTASAKDAPAPPAAPSLVEITPAAQAQVVQIGQGAAPGVRLRVRLEVVAGGCSGMFHRLSIDPDPPLLEDVVQTCGQVDCVFARDQLPFVQGTVIDWLERSKEKGFEITTPNRTSENREKTTAWVKREMEKQVREIRADIERRIVQLRDTASRDPDNELAHFQLAKLLMDDARYAEAVTSFERVLALAPDNAKAHLLLGECHLALGQRDRAASVLRKGKLLADAVGDQALGAEIAELLAKANASPDTKQ